MTEKRILYISSVEWFARVSATSGFGRGLPVLFGAISGQKGGFLGCFWGFSAPGGSSGCRTSSTSHGKPPKSRQM